MDTVNSFKGYGKVDERDEAGFRRKTRKRLIILVISAILLIALIVGVVAGTLAHRNNKNGSSDRAPATTSAALKSICGVTQYPESCTTSLSSSNSADPATIFRYSLSVAMDSLEKISNLPTEYIEKKTDLDEKTKQALQVCSAVLSDAVDSLNETVGVATASNGKQLLSIADDLRTWLSAVITDQDTCLDALEEAGANATVVADEFRSLMANSTEFASNSLAIVSKVIALIGGFKIPAHRRLLGEVEDGFPAWVGAAERRLLQVERPTPDVTVAMDGTGDVKTVNEAVKMLKKKSKTRFVIYVKAGVYVENVLLEKAHWNVMIYGDGAAATVISGSKNFVDGTPTFDTATFAVAGKGFIGRDIGFKNTAGALKHQAVALRSGSDQSVFHRCSFDAFQDTLYPHSNRQFYRDCNVTGTIDFIFGNAAVVFQNCNIMPRQPMSNQFVTITAQGKKDPNQNTGISIQRCVIKPFDGLKAPTYLGRPWKDYSTTIVMQTEIGGFLNPLGWISWVKDVEPPKSIFYAEYRNTGPGASTAGRVKWAGYRPAVTTAEAFKYTVNSFIQGPSWLPDANVAFDST
ncbi:pectinesterase 3 [Salvia miltiorrhiza]|uniref:pectinesterase 3 n=1 Tax=Salvia miltiorrhiza TaxID=226208 RepID=UPI0025AC606C|nr:pectinesterase 3 [Salvia miltiorrhiza]